ncbi:hypothetical protein, partial [Thiolapillus sp.]|uniref:hypothetical protein n=1 Tax=Thiolapillus sp. TaxID=2017437 RepID=UPI003AF50840
KNKFSRSVYRQYSVQGEAFEGELNGREQNLDPSVVVLFCKELKEKKSNGFVFFSEFSYKIGILFIQRQALWCKEK